MSENLTHRVGTILLRAPAGISDQDLANRIWQLLRRSIPEARPDMLVPESASLEVHVSTIDDEHDAFLRRTVFGADP